MKLSNWMLVLITLVGLLELFTAYTPGSALFLIAGYLWIKISEDNERV